MSKFLNLKVQPKPKSVYKYVHKKAMLLDHRLWFQMIYFRVYIPSMYKNRTNSSYQLVNDVG